MTTIIDRGGGLYANLRSGDRAPLTYGVTGAKSFYSSETQAGRSAILILAGSLPPEAIADIEVALRPHAPAVAQHEADAVLLVNAEGPHVMRYVANPPPGLSVVYAPASIFAAWGFADDAPALVVTDRNMRVLTVVASSDPPLMANEALASLASVPTEPAHDDNLPAPVLLVPNILSAALCAQLIEFFKHGDQRSGGMASIDAQGQSIHKIDESKKRRRDCLLPPQEALHRDVLDAMSRACLPEIKKAFQFDVNYVDRILIACYDESGGYFLRHRDNVAPAVAYRQFAVSINLNSDDYGGGYLLFPEYNSRRYRPSRGDGIVFSSSLLHEASPISRGFRYVLLTFLMNADGEHRRLSVA